MGHTYGDNAIQQFYKDPEKPGAYGVKQTWQESVHHVGAGHMGHLRKLMESVDYQKGRPAQELLLSGQKERYGRIAVFAGEDGNLLVLNMAAELGGAGRGRQIGHAIESCKPFGMKKGHYLLYAIIGESNQGVEEVLGEYAKRGKGMGRRHCAAS